MQALGSGKADAFDTELCDAPEDDINQLNDETFGAAVEEDWEEQHEKLANELVKCNRGSFNGAGDFYDGGQRYTAQDDLESSLSHMVDEDEPEPTYAQKNGQAIPAKASARDVDSLFGPSSPPGLLNAEELVGGQNIWGSPVRDSYMPKQDDGLKSLLKVLQTPKQAPVSIPAPQNAPVGTPANVLNNVLANAKTLEEIEKGSRERPGTQFPGSRERPVSQFPPQPPAPKPMVRTLEEIEQELTGHVPHKTQPVRKVPSPPQPGFPFPIGTPPQAPGFMRHPPPPSNQVPVPPGGRIMSLGRSPLPPPPPMPTPGQLPSSGNHGNLPPPPAIGSPGMAQITILQRNTPPPPLPGARKTSPPLIPGSVGAPKLGNARTSPVFILNQGGPVLRSPSPTELVHRAPAFFPTPPPPRPPPVSPNLYKTSLARMASSSPITQGILSGMLGNTELAGSPAQSGFPPRLPGDRPVSPLDGTPFMPRTPKNARMPAVQPYSDPTHHRGRGQGHSGPHHQPGMKNVMFSGNEDSRDSHNDHHHHNNGYNNSRHRDDYRGGPPRPGPPRGGRGGPGDFHGRGEFHNFRGGPPGMGPRDDFGHHRGGPRDYHRGGRGEYHGDRDYRGGRDDYNHPHHHHGFRGNRAGFRGGNNRGDGYHDGYHHRQRYNSYGDEDYEEDAPANKSGDEFAGLMTKKEKDWVIKIQLMQLQTENPYLDDFYYTSWAMKRMMEERQQQQALEKKKKAAGDEKSEPKLVIPHLARVETKGYRPVQFENSLGRVTASSVHNPRQIIDIKRTSSLDHDDPKAHEVRRVKELLLQIETGYDLLLDVDDLEKKALGLPEDSRPPLFAERQNNIHALYELIHGSRDDGLGRLLIIRKGIKLVCRLLPLLPPAEKQVILQGLLQNLTVISKKDWQKNVCVFVYQTLQPILHSLDLEALVGISRAISGGGSPTLENSTNTVLTALQNKFGSSVIWSLISRGEAIYSTVSPVDMELSHQEAWTSFVSLVATTLADLSKDQLACPIDDHPAAESHLRRLLDKPTLLAVEDKVQAITEATQELAVS